MAALKEAKDNDSHLDHIAYKLTRHTLCGNFLPYSLTCGVANIVWISKFCSGKLFGTTFFFVHSFANILLLQNLENSEQFRMRIHLIFIWDLNQKIFDGLQAMPMNVLFVTFHSLKVKIIPSYRSFYATHSRIISICENLKSEYESGENKSNSTQLNSTQHNFKLFQ